MSVSIEVLLDLEQAENATNQFRDEFITQVYAAAARGEEGMLEFANKSRKELEKLADAAKRESDRMAKAQIAAAKEAEQAQIDSANAAVRAQEDATRKEIAFRQNAKTAWINAGKEMQNASQQLFDQEQRELKDSADKWERRSNDLRGAIGDIGDAVGLLGEKFLGLKKAQLETLENTLALTEKGMALGAAFGPVGAAIGGVTGGILGYVKALEQKAVIEKTTRLAKAMAAIRAEEELERTRENYMFGVANNIIDSALEALGKAESVDQIVRDATKVEPDFGKKTSAELKKELKKIDDAIITSSKEISASKTELENALQKQREDTGLASAFGASSATRELEKTQAAVTEENRKILKSEEDINASIERRAQIQAELSSRKGKKSESVMTREELDKIVQAEREKEERLTSIQDGAEMRLKAQYDAEQAARQAALDLLRYYQDLEIIAVMEHNQKLLKTWNELEAKHTAIKTGAEQKKREEAQAKEAQEIEEYAATVNASLSSIGSMFSSAIGGVATDAFNSWLETIATGEKDAEQSFKKIAAAAVREIGSQLVADGVKNLLSGAAMAIAGPKKTGLALMGVGSAEIAAGVGMGAVGARAQRRQGFGDESNRRGGEGNLGRTASNAASTQVQAPSIINLGLLALTDQRSMEQAGRQIAHAQKAYQQGRR